MQPMVPDYISAANTLGSFSLYFLPKPLAAVGPNLLSAHQDSTVKRRYQLLSTRRRRRNIHSEVRWVHTETLHTENCLYRELLTLRFVHIEVFTLRLVHTEVCSHWDWFTLRFVHIEIGSHWGLFTLRLVRTEVCSQRDGFTFFAKENWYQSKGGW